MAEFLPAFERMIVNEGGYVLHTVKDDRGGATYAGLAATAHIANEWRIWRRDLSQEVFAGNRRHRAGDVDNEDADLHPTE